MAKLNDPDVVAGIKALADKRGNIGPIDARYLADSGERWQTPGDKARTEYLTAVVLFGIAIAFVLAVVAIAALGGELVW